MTKEQAKMFFDSDVEVLKQAFESDKEYADITNRIITAYSSTIFSILINKGILTESEAEDYVKQANELINKNGNEVEKDGEL